MNTLDILIIIIVGASAIYGAVRGFIRDIFSLIAIAIGIVLAIILYPWAASYVIRFVPDPVSAHLIGFATVFIIGAIAISILGNLISKAIGGTDISPYDRFAGACFGLIKGVLFSAVLIFFASILVPSVLTHSMLAPPISRNTEHIINQLPRTAEVEIFEFRNTLREIDKIPTASVPKKN
jgi:membrane protein required for colicin V production